jgi:hypothetical protein
MDGKSFEGEKILVEPTSKYNFNLNFHIEGRGRRGPSPNDKCWNCGKYGHW